MKMWLWLLKGFMKMNSSTHVFHGREEHCWLPPSLCTSEKSRHQTRWHQSGRQEGTHYLLKTNDATIKKLTRAAYRLGRIQKPFTHIWRWNWKFSLCFILFAIWFGIVTGTISCLCSPGTLRLTYFWHAVVFLLILSQVFSGLNKEISQMHERFTETMSQHWHFRRDQKTQQCVSKFRHTSRR